MTRSWSCSIAAGVAAAALATWLPACVDPDTTAPAGDVETGWAVISGPGGATARVPYAVVNGQAMIDDDVSLGEIDEVRARTWSAGSLAANDTARRWTDGIVYYSTSTNMTTSDLASLQAAFAQWGTTDSQGRGGASHLQFLPAVTGQSSIFYSKDGTGNWTQFTSTGFTIHLNAGFTTAIAAHETGHALGVIHEARRQDRNTFVIYHSECYSPAPNGLQPFQTINWGGTGAVKLSPYDLSSIMQYGSYNFSISNPSCPTLLAKAGAPAACSATNFNVTGMPSACLPYVLPGTTVVDGEDLNGVLQIYDNRLGSVENDDRYGEAMVAADFDGDGYEDLAVGAAGEGPYSSIHSGAVYLYKGTFNGLVAWKWLGEADFGVTPADSDLFGAALAAGYPTGGAAATLFVGAPGRTSYSGAVFRYDGGPGGPMAASGGVITLATGGAGTPDAFDGFGASLAAGSLHGSSGGLYLAVGAPLDAASSGGVRSGFVYTYQVTATALTFAQKFSSSSKLTPGNLDEFGSELAVGDVDGNGGDDLAVGAPFGTPTQSGAVVVFTGSSSGLTGSALLQLSGGEYYDRFGAALVFAKYDNSRKLLVGAPGYDDSSGRVYAYAASGWGLVQTIDQGDVGGTVDDGDEFGRALAAGNIDGTGGQEVVVGAPWEDNGGTDVGWIGVLHVDSDGKLGQWLNRRREGAGDELGYGLGVGDFDNDGNDDIAAGATGWASDGGNMDLLDGRSGNTPTFVEARSTETEHLL